ncbi:MAG: type II secretion system protein [Mariprofundales bacterium]
MVLHPLQAQANKQTGFTLIETIVAMAIAATALVVLLDRLGSSARIQTDIAEQTILLEANIDVLERSRLLDTAPIGGESGDWALGEQQLPWTLEIKKTALEGFMRQDVTIRMPSGGESSLFLYRDHSEKTN